MIPAFISVCAFIARPLEYDLVPDIDDFEQFDDDEPVEFDIPVEFEEARHA